MVRVLDSGSRDPGSGPGRGHCVVFLDTQVYKWVPAKMLGVTLRCPDEPSRFVTGTSPFYQPVLPSTC